MTQFLADKVALITGATRGIGAATAESFAGHGAKVVLNYGRSREEAEAVVTRIRAHGGEAMAVGADLAQADQVSPLFQEVMERFGRLDILVNNAGLAERKPIADMDYEHLQRVFALNVFGLALATREAARYLPRGGRIVNTASIAGQRPRPRVAVYAASKAAVESLTRSFAAELGPRDITVNAVAPGHVETRMGAGALPTEEARAAVVERTPLGRLGQPEDIARVITWLASEQAGWITGQVINADGGFAG